MGNDGKSPAATKPQLTAEQLAALKYDKHIALTANAGSGKTFVFAKRFVKIALEENPELDKIIAITFTEKAAGELYTRIVKEINTLAEEGREDKRKLNMIRKRLVSAKISTIHSFCLSLLRDYSPQAGLDANMTPVQPVERDALINKAFDEAFENELASSSLRALLRYFGSKKALRSTVKTAIDKRRFVDKLFAEVYSKGRQFTLEYLKKNADKYFTEIMGPQIEEAVEFIRDVNASVASEKPTQLTAEIDAALKEIDGKTRLFDKMLILKEVMRKIETKGGDLALRGYAGVLENKNLLKREYSKKLEFATGFDFGNPYENLEELAALSVDFFEFYSKTATLFKRAKYENGYLDFEDILIDAYELLKNKEVLDDLRSKYKYIMVDEYQDTNELQYEIIMPILNELKRGNLFVVGDEKQSIYMFNNAELEVFNHTKDNVAENRGEILELPHSFRLLPNNALFVNVLFSKIFSDPDVKYNEVGFSPLIVSDASVDGGRVEILLSVKDKEIQVPSEAEIVAAKIKNMLASGEIKLGETAVLTRQNKSLGELEKALAKEGVPYVVLGGVGYFQELVIRDIQNYLMFLSSVNNDLALVSVLRSPFYSLSDVDLLKISIEKGNAYWDKLRSYSELRENVKHVVESLERHLLYSEAFDIPTLLSKILAETNYWAVLASKENAEQEIANAKKLLAVSLETLRGEAVSLYEFAQKLNEAIKEIKDEGAAKTSEENKAVKIMTLHKSKGLEFDTVFLYKTNNRHKKTSVKSREITFDKDFGLLAKTPSSRGYFYEYSGNLLVWTYQYYIRRKELAESKRLFYVGATRARKNLFISAELNEKGEASENTFFDMLMKGLDFTALDNFVPVTGELAFGNEASKRMLNYEIKIERNSANTEFKFDSEFFARENDYIVNTELIDDREKNEFVSATKIALYRFCPFKYKLTYEYAYGKLFGLLKTADDFEFNAREEENVPANVLGSVLHKALELEIGENDFEEKLGEALVSTVKIGENKDAIKTRAEKILRAFIASEMFSWLRSKNNYKNEFEIYLKESDYYLYGIIDKLIFEENKIIVVDYKSDKIENNKFSEKFEQYENQLKFYLYILSKLYPEKTDFEARLVFLNYPDNSVTREYDLQEITDFGKEIKSVVEKIREKQFPKNKKNCRKCVYYSDGNCVA